MFVYHLPLSPPLPPASVSIAYTGKGGGKRVGGGAQNSDNVKDGVPTLSFNGAEGRRKVHVLSVPRSQRCTGWVLSGELCSLSFHLGFPERLRGPGG